ncbi:hypothetical protein H0H92_012956 [Tricholoma furcatifolium]|nr:hypothetical protein H0H92_012956 [Tricholoma furcatifolium]
MPKISLPSLPVSGLFGIAKPSGPTSMSVINDVKILVSQSRLFVDADKLEKSQGQKHKRKHARGGIKIGQGGTLDPLADGVLGEDLYSLYDALITASENSCGSGKGDKKTEYRTTCLLGCETDTYDSEGSRVRVAPWQHITREQVESALAQFSGEIQQTPPIFSALKMDGRPLYEYARKGIPLPRPIEPRKVTVHSLELVEWLGTNHTYRWPEKTFSEAEKHAMETALKGATEDNVSVKDDLDPTVAAEVPNAFVLKMKVSGGTYVRSIVHDLAHSLGSAGHVVTLTRSRQGRFSLEPQDGEFGCLPWDIFQKASVEPGDADEEGWTKWEREVLNQLDVVN